MLGNDNLEKFKFPEISIENEDKILSLLVLKFNTGKYLVPINEVVFFDVLILDCPINWPSNSNFICEHNGIEIINSK